MDSFALNSRRLSKYLRTVACIGFTGLVILSLLTMVDGVSRWLALPRIPGFLDISEIVYAIVITCCFPVRRSRLCKWIGATLWRGSRPGGRRPATFPIVFNDHGCERTVCRNRSGSRVARDFGAVRGGRRASGAGNCPNREPVSLRGRRGATGQAAAPWCPPETAPTST